VDDLDHHLRWCDRAQHLLPERLFADRGDKIPDHRERHIGLEQGDPDLPQGGPDIILAQRTVPAQPVEDIAEALTQAVKHSDPQNPLTRRKAPVRETRGLAAPGKQPDRPKLVPTPSAVNCREATGADSSLQLPCVSEESAISARRFSDNTFISKHYRFRPAAPEGESREQRSTPLPTPHSRRRVRSELFNLMADARSSLADLVDRPDPLRVVRVIDEPGREHLVAVAGRIEEIDRLAARDAVARRADIER